MKILFTTKGDKWESPMDERFGRSESFLLFDESNESFENFDNSENGSLGHGAGLQSSQKVIELAPDVIITGNGAGQKALAILKKTNIKMYIGAGDMDVKGAYDAFKNNMLAQQF